MAWSKLRTPTGRGVVLGLLLLAACGDAARSANAPAPARQADGGALFVVTAPAATLTRSGEGSGRLTLHGAASGVVEFSDRPARRANTLALSAFVGSWEQFGFAASPPNAALVIDDAAPDGDVAVFELESPRIDGSDLVFDVRPLRRPVTPGLQAFADRADPAVAPELGRVSLFVDNASTGADVVYQQVTLQISNALPGQTIEIDLFPAGGASVGWSTGPAFDAVGGIAIVAQGSVLPLSQLSLSSSRIEIMAPQAGGSPVNLALTAYLAADPAIDSFILRNSSDQGVAILAAVGSAPALPVNPSDTLFPWFANQ